MRISNSFACFTLLVRLFLAAAAVLLTGLATPGCHRADRHVPVADSRTDTAQPELAADLDTATDRPLIVAHGGYVSSAACVECHPGEHATWHASYHRTMTQVASPETVQGDFSGEELEFYGWRFKPERVGDDFFINVAATSDDRSFRHKLVMTTGSHHMQKYWYHTGASRKMGLAPLVYLLDSDKWVPEHTAFLRPTESGLAIREGDWNKGCNQCHATGSLPRLSSESNMDTHVVEFGISCEACHGPGEKHVANQRAASIVNPRNLSAERSSQVCGQCHGAWAMKGSAGRLWARDGHLYRPGDDLHEFRTYLVGRDGQKYRDQIRAEDSFWGDGEIRVAGREYNGLLASPCFANAPSSRKMTCIACHDMHAESYSEESSLTAWSNDQLGAEMSGNEACLQCHTEYRDNLVAHTKHPANSAGSVCYNCHMTYTSYGLMKAVRSHTISVPSVASSVMHGRPNACNQCHLDQTLAWTQHHLKSRYGIDSPPLTNHQRNAAASILWAAKGDAGQRAIVAWSMGWKSAQEASGTDWMIFYLSDLMFDEYDAIRNVAYKSLKTIPGYESIQYDYMKPDAERDRVVAEIMGIWQKTASPVKEGRLLFDPNGQLRFDVYQRMRSERDNRPIVITE